MDSRGVTDVDETQLLALTGIAAEHRFLDGRRRAKQIVQDSATRFPSFAVACYRQLASVPDSCGRATYLMGGRRVVWIVPGLAPDAFDEGTDFVG